jgi:hypothetical protein
MGYNPDAVPDPSQPPQLGPTAMGAQIDHVETVYEWEWRNLKQNYPILRCARHVLTLTLADFT